MISFRLVWTLVRIEDFTLSGEYVPILINLQLYYELINGDKGITLIFQEIKGHTDWWTDNLGQNRVRMGAIFLDVVSDWMSFHVSHTIISAQKNVRVLNLDTCTSYTNMITKRQCRISSKELYYLPTCSSKLLYSHLDYFIFLKNVNIFFLGNDGVLMICAAEWYKNHRL